MSSDVIFHGNEREIETLVQIVARNCTCASTNYNGHTCAVHNMLSSDQRAIDELVHVRRTCDRYVCAEHIPVGFHHGSPSMTTKRGQCTC